MQHIKTCYGEWINPALVQHFGITFKEYPNKEYWLVCADDVTITLFEIELPPCDENIWRKNRYEETAEDRAKQQEWYEACKIKRTQVRAKACAWLAELIAKIDSPQ